MALTESKMNQLSSKLQKFSLPDVLLAIEHFIRWS